MTQHEIECKYVKAKSEINATHQQAVIDTLASRDNEIATEILPRESALQNLKESQQTARMSLKAEGAKLHGLCYQRDNNTLTSDEVKELEQRLVDYAEDKKRYEIANITVEKAKSEVRAMRQQITRKFESQLLGIHREREVALQKAREEFYNEMTNYLKAKEA